MNGKLLGRRFLTRGSTRWGAENEMTTLDNYDVNTDEYKRVLSGSARLAVGRKGSGKTALFFQAGDYSR